MIMGTRGGHGTWDRGHVTPGADHTSADVSQWQYIVFIEYSSLIFAHCSPSQRGTVVTVSRSEPGLG